MLGFGDVRRGECSLAATSVTRRFTADVLLTTTGLQCDGHKLTLYGYGRAANVLDFHNIVGVLLESDLEDLESALSARWGWLPFHKKQGLRPSLARMIESEAHQVICKSEEARDKLIANGIVSADHCTRTFKGLRKGMGRLYRPAALLLTCALAILVMSFEIALFYFGHHLRSTPQVILFLVALLAAAIAAGGERLIQKRVTSVFPKDQQAGALVLLKSTGAIPRWRIALVIVALLSVFGLPTTGYVVNSYEAAHPVLYAPVPRSIENGWQVFDAADLHRESNASKGFIRALHMSGNILIRGDLEQVRIAANFANIRIDGSLRGTQIDIEGNGTVVVKDSDRSWIWIKGDGSITMNDVNRSTIMAKHLTVRKSTLASLVCQDIRVLGSEKLGTQVSKHPWK
jgi:hypothetical protein